MQRRVAVGVLDVGVAAGSQQIAHNCCMAPARSIVQRRAAILRLQPAMVCISFSAQGLPDARSSWADRRVRRLTRQSKNGGLAQATHEQQRPTSTARY